MDSSPDTFREVCAGSCSLVFRLDSFNKVNAFSKVTSKVIRAVRSLQYMRLLPDLRTKIPGSFPVWFLMLAKCFSGTKRMNLQVRS